MVNLIISAVLIIVIAVSTFIGYKKGFLKMIAGFIEYIVAFLSAYVFCSRLSVYVKKISFIDKLITDIEMPVLDENMGLVDKVKKITSYIVDNVILAGDSSSSTMKAIGNNYLAEIISTAISFIAIFIAVILIIKFVVWIIGLLFKAPVLKQIDGVLGSLFGFFCGSFWTWIISNTFVKAILPVLIAQFPQTFDITVADNVIIKFFLNTNPLTLFFNALTWIGDKLS